MSDELHCTRDQLAQVFGVTPGHVTKMYKAGMPRVRHGVWSIPDCVQWRIAEALRGARFDDDQSHETRAAREQWYSAQTRAKELEIARQVARVVDGDDARDALLRLSAVLVTFADMLPLRACQELAKESDAALCMEILKRHADQLRTELQRTSSELVGAICGRERDVEPDADDPDGEVGGRKPVRTGRESTSGAVAN